MLAEVFIIRTGYLNYGKLGSFKLNEVSKIMQLLSCRSLNDVLETQVILEICRQNSRIISKQNIDNAKSSVLMQTGVN